MQVIFLEVYQIRPVKSRKSSQSCDHKEVVRRGRHEPGDGKLLKNECYEENFFVEFYSNIAKIRDIEYFRALQL
jgi:hypothetical protein